MTDRAVGYIRDARDRAGPVNDAGQSSVTCVAMPLSLMSVAVEVREIGPVPALFWQRSGVAFSRCATVLPPSVLLECSASVPM